MENQGVRGRWLVMAAFSDSVKKGVINLATSGFQSQTDVEVLRKIILLNIVCTTGIVILLPMAVLAIFQSNHILGYCDLSMAAILIFNIVYLRRTGNYSAFIYFSIILAMLFFLYLFFTGGVGNSAFVWYYTFPLFALFLLGTRKGIFVCLFLFLCALGFFVLDPRAPFFATYSTNLKLRFIPSFIVVFIYSYVFEFMREKTQKKLVDKNEEVNRTVKELELTKVALEESRHELEQKVRVRTAELSGMNKALEQEVHERKRAQTELLLSNERFATVLDSIDANIHVSDIETCEVLFINKAMENNFGNDLVGKKCWQITGNNEEDPGKCCNREHLFGPDGKPVGVHVWESHDPVSGKWYINYDRAIPWVNGRYVVARVSVDVSERVKAEYRLKQLRDKLEIKVNQRTREIGLKNKALRKEVSAHRRTANELKTAKEAAESASQAKSEFLANMSHELRTPLNHIIGFTELVVDQNFGPLSAEQTEYLGDVLYSSRHLLSLINDILDLSKIDAGKLELSISEIHLPLLLENSLVMIKEKALKHGIDLVTDFDGIPDTIRADERKLKQILYNLLSNAAKFTSDGGQIRLMARRLPASDTDPAGGAAADAIEISVADTGIGIAAEDLERVFAPFEQVQSSTTRQYQGTGLGLPLSRQLVELHGGRIWAQSKGKTCGAVFSFTLPIGGVQDGKERDGSR